MVVDTAYYDALEIAPTATPVEIKKAYRRLAIIHHPDKNPDDPEAHDRFQTIGEAYQVLSDKDLRKIYDEQGKAKPEEGFVDPTEFFSSIFGGESFHDWIGEFSTLSDLAAMARIAGQDEEEEEAEAAAAAENKAGDGEFPGTSEAIKESLKTSEADHEKNSAAGTSHPPGAKVEDERPVRDDKPATPSTPSRSDSPSSASASSGVRRTAIPIRPALMYSEASIAEQDKDKEKELHKKKEKGLSKEQREQLQALEEERARVRTERVEMLAGKLVDRLSIWTETDMGTATTHSFKEKLRLEAEELKMESFGVEIIHAIAQIYMLKATILIRSQSFLGGIGGFFSRVKDKGNVVKETWHAVSSAIDAQNTFLEVSRMEEEAGENWTDDEKTEAARRVSGKVLNAAWRVSKSEVTGVLRAVCDSVLNDKKVPIEKRLERAQAMVLLAEVFQNVRRSPGDEEYMVWEQLVAESAMKKKDTKRKKKDDKHVVTAENAYVPPGSVS